MDDGNVVKVYIPLEGELFGLTMEDIEIEFADRSLGAWDTKIDAATCRHHLRRRTAAEDGVRGGARSSGGWRQRRHEQGW